MADQVCIFEGINYRNLLPLVHFRPVYNLRTGILSLREKIERSFPNIPITLHSRDYLKDVVQQNNPKLVVNKFEGKSILFINGRVIANSDFAELIPLDGPDKLYVNGEDIVAARISGSKLNEIKRVLHGLLSYESFEGLIKEEVDVQLIKYPWDLVHNNGTQIRSDYELIDKSNNMQNIKLYDGVYLLNKDEIFIGEGTSIKPGVTIDAENGPVYIGKNVTIFSNAYIEGPCYIGDNSIIKVNAAIYENCSIGKVCKVGGEIEESIIHGYSNKQHDGFLGHSYLGTWINLGASTTNSDLKNNYGSVKVILNNEQIDSGLQFVGLTIGDHSKTAIHTVFNTGTVVGVSCNIFGEGFPPKYIPSFSWGGKEMLTTYNIDKADEVAERVMLRRNIKFTKVDRELFSTVYDLTSDERRKRGMPF